jgi:DNA-binding transcriptional regulator YhcF (GntR family)
MKVTIAIIVNIVNMLAVSASVTMLDMRKLDPDDTRPPYAQVVDALRREIEQGVLRPGTKLPTHQQLVSQYGVSIGTVKRALGELQGAGLIISRQGQGAFVRTRRSLLASVPPSFSVSALAGFWVTGYQFNSKRGLRCHADITKLTSESDRQVTAKNYPPDPRTQGRMSPFRNEIEAQLVNRHLIGHWKNISDTRYFGSIHLAVMPGEKAMEGYYTSFSSDIQVDALRWKWVRLDPISLSGVELSQVVLKEPDVIYALLENSAYDTSLALTVVVEGNSR